MTYSIELFTFVVIGLCLGHFVFNTKSAVGESIDPCCASQQGPPSSSIIAAVSNNRLQTVNSTNHVPLTRTPCDLEGQMDSENEELQVDIVKCGGHCNGDASKTEEKRPPSY